jgi:hypothetical protein
MKLFDHASAPPAICCSGADSRRATGTTSAFGGGATPRSTGSTGIPVFSDSITASAPPVYSPGSTTRRRITSERPARSLPVSSTTVRACPASSMPA